MLYANVSEYLAISEAVGFRITVHDKWTVPFADAFGYNAPTGFMSSFGVRMVCTKNGIIKKKNELEDK
jgi:acid-sensing ion channel, other